MTEPTVEEPLIWHKAYARIGLLGNPSDGYYGKTISLTIGNFWAEVRPGLQYTESLSYPQRYWETKI